MRFHEVRESWERLSPAEGAALTEARLQCHWAVQPLQALADARVAPQTDFAHLSLSWNLEDRFFEGHATGDGFRARVAPRGLRMSVVGSGPSSADGELALEGLTLEEALAWLSEAASPRTGEPMPDPLRRPAHELPRHPVADGRTFSARPAAAFDELARWYGNARRFLDHVREGTPGASPVRIWPHHFDMAALITLDPSAPDPETARSIGVGFSPGDGTYAEPYFYVNPWPPPTGRALPTLDGRGHWHQEGWLGAVLLARDLDTGSDATTQPDQVHAFVESGIRAALDVLDATDPP